jgi:hypothetical protein
VSSWLLGKPGDEGAEKSSSERKRGGRDRCAVEILRAPKLDEVRRSSGASSPDGGAQAMGGNSEGHKRARALCARRTCECKEKRKKERFPHL